MAREEAKEVVERLEKSGKLGKLGIDEKDQAAREALEVLVATLYAAVPIKERNIAARTILDFTLEKPATKAEHTINKAEEFLEKLVSED